MPASKQGSFLGSAVVAGGLTWAALKFQPFVIAGEVQPIPAVVGCLALIALLRTAALGLERAAGLMDWFAARSATGKAGTSRWAKWSEIKRERSKRGGLFWGVMAGTRRPLFIDFVSNAMTLGPAGSGKTESTVIPAILAIRDSKVVGDFKAELVCACKEPLERRGERVRVLNPGQLYSDLVGPGDCFNPMHTLVDDLCTPGGLLDVPDRLRELTHQIHPEPSEQANENRYWGEGSRTLIGNGVLFETLIEEYEGRFSTVAQLLEDRRRFADTARMFLGVDLQGHPLPAGPLPIERAEWAKAHHPQDVADFACWIRARASNVVALADATDSRTFDNFISGAQQALAPFAFGRLAPAMSRSTFSMSELKDGKQPTTLFIVADASRVEAFKPYMGLMQWSALTAIKRHPNKKRPVYCILDEITNYKINGLESLLTWGRSYGARLFLCFQDIAAFERTYGKSALQTLLSETEIKQFLPGQRSQQTLELLSKMLGEQSVMTASLSNQNGRVGLSETTAESGRSLMTADEIRRTPYGILFVRRAAPALIEPVSYAAIRPWRRQVGINPFWGKRYLKPVRVTVR